MGNMVRVRVEIEGVRPMLQHRFGEDAIPLEKQEKTGVAGNDPEEWRRTCMVTPAGQLYTQPSYIYGMMVTAGKYTKMGRGSIQARVAATLQVEEPIIPLNRWMPDGSSVRGVPPPPDPTAPVYLDIRGVRNPTTKGRNVRYRLAASAGWRCSFTLAWDKTVVQREVMRTVMRDASVLVGLSDARSIGFGRFNVLSWAVQPDDGPAEEVMASEANTRLNADAFAE